MSSTALLTRSRTLNSLNCVEGDVLQFQGLYQVCVSDQSFVHQLEVTHLLIHIVHLLYAFFQYLSAVVGVFSIVILQFINRSKGFCKLTMKRKFK